MVASPAVARIIQTFPLLQWLVHLVVTRCMRLTGALYGGRQPMQQVIIRMTACTLPCTLLIARGTTPFERDVSSSGQKMRKIFRILSVISGERAKRAGGAGHGTEVNALWKPSGST